MRDLKYTITCEDFQGEVYAYLDREMDAERFQLFHSHCNECQACAQICIEAKSFETELVQYAEMIEPKSGAWERFSTRLASDEGMELDVNLPKTEDRFKSLRKGMKLGGVSAACFAIAWLLIPQVNEPLIQAADSKELLAQHEPLNLTAAERFNYKKEYQTSLHSGSELGSIQNSLQPETSLVEKQNPGGQPTEELPVLEEIFANEKDLNAVVAIPGNTEIKSYYMDKFPVTNQEYERFVKSTGHQPPFNWDKGTYKNFDRNGMKPVTYVSWEDANAFCSWEGKSLPSLKQWQKAAGDKTYPWGDSFSKKMANTKESGLGLREIGSYRGNVSQAGVYDMAGNVRQWVSDDAAASIGLGQMKIMKGGSFMDEAQKSMISSQFTGEKDIVYGNTGIRCVSGSAPRE